ncbi:MAG: nuclear transport factor 2 family protein [Gemmatimonadaceae bacterium]
MHRITQAWRDGRVDDMAPVVHPAIVLVLPGFSGHVQGREEFLAGYRDFVLNATIQEFHERDHRIDIAGDTAVVTFTYEMRYERSGAAYRATGRELWVFQRHGTAWIAVWRTMLDLNESATS